MKIHDNSSVFAAHTKIWYSVVASPSLLHDLIWMAERDDELGDRRVAEVVDSDVAFDDDELSSRRTLCSG